MCDADAGDSTCAVALLINKYIVQLKANIYFLAFLCSCWFIQPEEVGLVVECLTTDPRIVGSNPDGAEFGLHVFRKPHYGHEYCFTQEANIESGSV